MIYQITFMVRRIFVDAASLLVFKTVLIIIEVVIIVFLTIDSDQYNEINRY